MRAEPWLSRWRWSSGGGALYNLGVDLPVEEFKLGTERLHPSAVGLSFVLSRNIKKRFQELEKLRTVPVFVGGRSIVNYQSLARSHGLIPVVGPIGKSADLFVVEFEHWSRLDWPREENSGPSVSEARHAHPLHR